MVRHGVVDISPPRPAPAGPCWGTGQLQGLARSSGQSLHSLYAIHASRLPGDSNMSRAFAAAIVFAALVVSAPSSEAAADAAGHGATDVDAVILHLDRRELAILDLPTPNSAHGAIHFENARYLAGEAASARQRIEPRLLHGLTLAEIETEFCAHLKAELPSAGCQVVDRAGLDAAVARLRGSAQIMLFELSYSTYLNFAAMALSGTLSVGRAHPSRASVTRSKLKLRVSSNYALVGKSPSAARGHLIERWLANDFERLDNATSVHLRDLAVIAGLAVERPQERWCTGPRVEYRYSVGYARGWRMAERLERSVVYGETRALLGMASDMISRTIRARAPCPPA